MPKKSFVKKPENQKFQTNSTTQFSPVFAGVLVVFILLAIFNYAVFTLPSNPTSQTKNIESKQDLSKVKVESSSNSTSQNSSISSENQQKQSETKTENPTDKFFYTIQKGDTLDRISILSKSSIQEILVLNPNLNPNVILAGQKISLPNELKIETNSPTQTATNVVEKVVVGVPLIKQKYPLSCELASMQMAMNYYGIEKTEEQWLGEVGLVNPYQKSINQWKNTIWGDPDYGFVGDMNGQLITVDVNGKKTIKNATGYGVSNGPVAVALKKYKPNTFAKDGATQEDIKQALRGKKPVLFWHVIDEHADLEAFHYTPSGKKIRLVGTHTAVINGFEIKANGEEIFFVNDPWGGYVHYTSEHLQRVMKRHGSWIVVVG